MKNRINACIKLAGTLSCAIVLTACSGSSSTSTSGNEFDFGDDDDCIPQNAGCYFETTSGSGESVVQFDGSWLSGCVRLEDYDGQYSDDAAYRVEALAIGGNVGTQTNNYYTDSACASPATVSEVASSLELYYASIFTDNTVGVDNIVLVNIQASGHTFDSVEPDADQEAEMTRARATRTLYTAMQKFDTELLIGTPGSFSDGSNSDDRILSALDGITYTQQ